MPKGIVEQASLRVGIALGTGDVGRTRFFQSRSGLETACQEVADGLVELRRCEFRCELLEQRDRILTPLLLPAHVPLDRAARETIVRMSNGRGVEGSVTFLRIAGLDLI